MIERNWRSPHIVGGIYRVTDLTKDLETKRIVVGDLVLFVELTGDCYYTLALLEQREENETHRYYGISKITQGYSAYFHRRKNDDPVRVLDNAEIVSALSSMHIIGRSAVVLEKSREEVMKKSLGEKCPMCNHIKTEAEIEEAIAKSKKHELE